MASAPGFEKHPEHRIETAIVDNHVRVTFNGAEIADTRAALRMNEGSYPPVFYVPRKDVDMSHLQATDHESYCPFKGQARYWSVNVGDATAANAVWGYDDPYDELATLRDYVAFYTDRVDVEVA